MLNDGKLSPARRLAHAESARRKWKALINLRRDAFEVLNESENSEVYTFRVKAYYTLHTVRFRTD